MLSSLLSTAGGNAGLGDIGATATSGDAGSSTGSKTFNQGGGSIGTGTIFLIGGVVLIGILLLRKK